MDIILKQDIDKLGFKNDIVTVKNGYGLNYLIPQGYAVLATPSARKVNAENIKQQAHKATKMLEEAQGFAEKLNRLSLKIGAKASENGKIFGSVNTIQLADAIKAAGHEVDRKRISIQGDAIKTLGEYEASVRLHKEVSATVKFEVIQE